jgi:DNA-binding transcriptional MerR regulator
MSRLSGTGLLIDCDTHTVNVVNQPGRVIPVSPGCRTTGVAPSEPKGPMSEPAEAAAELITLDALTRRVGMSVRNIRFYATKGLVPPPIRRGRSGYYSPDHVARLELVSELQAHGFTLSAIEKYLAKIPADASPETIALHRTLLAPWMAELPETLSRRELGRRAGRPLSDDDLDTLNALGIVFPTKQGKFQVAIAHLSVGVALLDLGMPLDAALAAQDIFTQHGRQVAEELTELFRTKVWPAYKGGDSTPEQLRELVEKFKPVTVQALVTAYESAVNETKRETISRRTR